MQERLNAAKRVLYTAIVLACVLAILKILYNTGYSLYVSSEYYNDWKVWEKLSYQIYYSKVLKTIGKVLFYSGLVAVYAMWEKPRPNCLFVLIVLAALLPVLELKTVRELMHSNFQAWDYTLAYNIMHKVFWLIWTIAKWIIIAKLYTDAEKEAKPIFALYMITLGAWLIVLMQINLYGLPRVIFTISYYTSIVAEVLLYVMTIVYLKKKLGANMPFTNAVRFLKKECINRAPVD